MDILDILGPLAGFAVAIGVVGGIALGWAGFFRARALGRRMERADDRLDRLERNAGLDPAAASAAAPRPPPLKPEPPPLEPEQPQPATTTLGAPEGFERALTGRWTVWLGAAALVLAGVFLVEYSMSQGWLGPAARCALAAAGGLAAILAGEWLRRRGPRLAGAAQAPEAALTAAGAAVLYGSAYAAHALYGLLPAAPAFAAFAVVSAAACALALLHGRTVAVIGVGGGYLLPLAISSDAPSAPTLFMFLAALTAAAAWLAQRRGWRFLAWMALAGAALWPALWIAAMWRPGDAAVVGAYLAVVALLFLFPLPGAGERRETVAATAACVFALLVFALVRADGYGVSVAALAFVCGAYLAAARRGARLDWLGPLALALALALAAAFHIEQVTDAAGRTLGVEGWRYDLGRRAVAPALEPFLAFCALFAALFAAAGSAAALRSAQRPWLWAGMSAAAPVGLFAVAYWRIEAFQTDGAWAGAAVAIAAAAALAAERAARRRGEQGMEGALAAWAAGAAAALGLGMAALLETAWLTVALSLFVPALAAIHDRLPLAGLRHVALAAAGVVIARLLFNVRVLEYPDGGLPGLDWAIYGYGAPLAAFWWAARRFAAHRRDALVRVLEAGALAFGVALVFWQTRLWAAGDAASASFGFTERALHAAAWLAIAWALYQRAEGPRRDVLGWGWRLLAGAAAAGVAALQVLLDGPLTRPIDVGPWPGLNLLLLAYGLPALFAAAFLGVARRRGRGDDRIVAAIAGPLAFALALVWLTLEVRRAFYGGVLSEGAVGGAEGYAYTMAWLAWAGVLLAFGMKRAAPGLRRAALFLLALTTAKLFLFDMAALEGLYRVASFLGLGLSLVGLGYLYQRFVFPPPRGAGGAAAP